MSYSLLEAFKELNEVNLNKSFITLNGIQFTPSSTNVYHATKDVDTLIKIFNQRVIKRKILDNISKKPSYGIFLGDGYDDQLLPLHFTKNKNKFTCAINFNKRFKEQWCKEYKSQFLKAMQREDSKAANSLRVNYIEKRGDHYFMGMSEMYPDQEIPISATVYNIIKTAMEDLFKTHPELEKIKKETGGKISYNNGVRWSSPLITSVKSVATDSKRKPENGIYIYVPLKEAENIAEEDTVDEFEYIIEQSLAKDGIWFDYSDVDSLILPKNVQFSTIDGDKHIFNFQNMIEEYKKLNGKDYLEPQSYMENGEEQWYYNASSTKINFCSVEYKTKLPSKGNLDAAGFDYDSSAWYYIDKHNKEKIKIKKVVLRELNIFISNIVKNNIDIRWI